MKNPLKKPSLKDKVTHAVVETAHHVPLPRLPHHHKTPRQRYGEILQHALVYLAFFVAGFVLSKIHTLITLS